MIYHFLLSEYILIWHAAGGDHRKRLEKGKPFKKKKLGRQLDKPCIHHVQADQLDFLQPARAGSHSLRLPVGRRDDMSCMLLRRGEPGDAVVLN